MTRKEFWALLDTARGEPVVGMTGSGKKRIVYVRADGFDDGKQETALNPTRRGLIRTNLRKAIDQLAKYDGWLEQWRVKKYVERKRPESADL